MKLLDLLLAIHRNCVLEFRHTYTPEWSRDIEAFIATLEAENAELKHELAVTKAEKQELSMRLNTNLELEPILSDYGIKVGRKLNKKLNIGVFILTDIYGNELPPAGKEGE
jgi:hypothetical protein